MTLLNTKEKLQSDKEAVELETMKVENIGKKKKTLLLVLSCCQLMMYFFTPRAWMSCLSSVINH